MKKKKSFKDCARTRWAVNLQDLRCSPQGISNEQTFKKLMVQKRGSFPTGGAHHWQQHFPES